MLRLYDYAPSGNCYKVRLLLCQLGMAYERIPIDIIEGQARTLDFTAKNPAQKVPVLEWPDGRRLAESNAILFHLSEGTPYLPAESWQRSLVLQWLFFEQFSHAPYIGAVRFWRLSGAVDENRNVLDGMIKRGYRALRIVEDHLSRNDFLVGNRYGIADISIYSYTHVAGEGGFDLEPYPAVRAWIGRVAGQARHLSITD